jgi:murein DD-endopeptidase MepM/ murein hydrolase activator NlpD
MAVAGEPHSPHHKRTRKDLGKSLSRIKGKKHEARLELRAARARAHGVKLDIVSVDSKLDTARNRLQQTEQQLAEARGQSRLATQALGKATEELAQTRRLVSNRIRHIYMDGNESMMSTFSGTKSAGQVASHSYLMEAIERKDRLVFNRYLALQKQVAERKRDADRRVAEVKRFEAAQTAQAKTLSENRKAKAKLLRSLQAKQEDLEAMIAQFQKDEEQIGAEIEAFERELAARRRASGIHNITGSFTGRFLRPVGAPVTSTFGMRYHPILHRVRMHTGIDFGASYGTPIHAAATGEVIFASYMNGYGHVVIIDHGGGYSTVYGHASRVYVSRGQHVSAGQTIAAVGASGLATGPHLHFEVRVNGHPVNPLGKL